MTPVKAIRVKVKNLLANLYFNIWSHWLLSIFVKSLGIVSLQIGAPVKGTDGDSFNLDMSTSAVAVGKIEMQVRCVAVICTKVRKASHY